MIDKTIMDQIYFLGLVTILNIILIFREKNVRETISKIRATMHDLYKQRDGMIKELSELKINNDKEYQKQYYELNLSAYSLFYQAEFVRAATNNLIGNLDKDFNKKEIEGLKSNIEVVDKFTDNIRKNFLSEEVKAPFVKFDNYEKGCKIGNFFSKN